MVEVDYQPTVQSVSSALSVVKRRTSGEMASKALFITTAANKNTGSRLLCTEIKTKTYFKLMLKKCPTR